MSIKKLKKIKNYSIIVVPEETSSEPKSIKISSVKLLTYILIYSLIVFVIGFYIISFTPLSEVLFPYSLRLTDSDKKKLEILNNKVVFLAKEVESLKSVNQRLKFAIMLGDSTILNEQIQKKDTTKSKIKTGGNILSVFQDFINKFIFTQEGTITFVKPVDGYVSNFYDPGKAHYGLDYVMKFNSPVYASAGGYVVFADYTPDYGYTIVLNHQDNYVTKYLHCASLIKKSGDLVKQGELIALSGNSGTESSGPHLHFEIWKDGKTINPSNVLITY
jgi:murein DD-endopeptidase MepM/ murein hydrolase activator NlpD